MGTKRTNATTTSDTVFLRGRPGMEWQRTYLPVHRQPKSRQQQQIPRKTVHTFSVSRRRRLPFLSLATVLWDRIHTAIHEHAVVPFHWDSVHSSFSCCCCLIILSIPFGSMQCRPLFYVYYYYCFRYKRYRFLGLSFLCSFTSSAFFVHLFCWPLCCVLFTNTISILHRIISLCIVKMKTNRA